MSISIKEYFALAGSSFSNDDARVIGPVLQELAADGDVTADAVVQAAHSPNSPLRKYFEWDDKRAAGLYREGQAREMIQSVRVRFVSEGKEYATRAYNVTVRKENNYLPREIEANNVLPHPHEQLVQALREIDAWRLKYTHLETFKRIKDILMPLLNQIAEFREDFSQGKEPVDLERALAALTEWRAAYQPKLPSTELYGEHFGYMAEAIDVAWDAYSKMKGQRDARFSAIEEENADLKEKVRYLEEMLAGKEIMPREFRLTGKEEQVVSALLERDVLSKESILSTVYNDRPNDVPDIKIVDVFVCRIRPKLEPYGIKIETVWGHGYTIPAESKAELRGMIEARKAAAA